MSTDRELLELAAKAAGIDVAYWVSNPGGEFFVLADDGPEWNPLTDDGDALRLAVRLDFAVCVDRQSGNVRIDGPYPQAIELVNEPIVDDPYAATRRAIVRAAASIGKHMQENTNATD